jgi:hypothetical protein
LSDVFLFQVRRQIANTMATLLSMDISFADESAYNLGPGFPSKQVTK